MISKLNLEHAARISALHHFSGFHIKAVKKDSLNRVIINHNIQEQQQVYDPI